VAVRKNAEGGGPRSFGVHYATRSRRIVSPSTRGLGFSCVMATTLPLKEERQGFRLEQEETTCASVLLT